MSDDVERERARYEALAALVDGYRRERDDAREQLYMTKAELGRWVDRETKAARERDEARREADRFRHGCTVEGDFVCPNEYAVSELTAERNFLRALKKNHEEDFTRVCKERDEARAERDLARERFEHAVQSATRYAVERDEARAEVERLRETKDYLRTWLSSEELEGLRVKAAEHPLLWEEIHHLKAEVERLREALEADGET